MWGIALPFLTKEDRKYERSGAGEGKGGRPNPHLRRQGSGKAPCELTRLPLSTRGHDEGQTHARLTKHLCITA